MSQPRYHGSAPPAILTPEGVLETVALLERRHRILMELREVERSLREQGAALHYLNGGSPPKED